MKIHNYKFYSFRTVYPNTVVTTVWIGAPTNETYNKLQNTMCIDESCLLHVSVASGQCTALTNVVTSSDIWIVDNTTCTGAYPYFCEKGKKLFSKIYTYIFFHDVLVPTYQKKGCGQSLNGVVVQSVSVATSYSCAQQCTTYDWCTGVNYNQTGQVCQILKENSTVQSLACYNAGWDYFERF